MVLEFPILADYALLELEGRTVYLSHGHIYHEGNLPPLMPGDAFYTGIPMCRGRKRKMASFF